MTGQTLPVSTERKKDVNTTDARRSTPTPDITTRRATRMILVRLDRSGHAPWTALDSRDGVARAALRPRVNARELVGILAHDLLTALGHPGHRTTEASGGTALGVLPAYLAAHDIRDLVITGAERLNTVRDVGELVTAIDHLTPAGCQVWLVWEGTEEMALLDEHPDAEEIAISTAREYWASREADTSGCEASFATPPSCAGTPRADPFPPVPSDEALTFLASVHELLPPPEAARVRTTTLEAADLTLRLCYPQLSGGAPHSARVAPKSSVIHHLRGRIETTRDVNEAVAVARGVQLALFHAGWWLTIDIDDFVDTYLASPPPPPAAREAWAQLMIYRTPLVGAVAALAAAGVSRSGLETCTLRDVAADYSTVREGWRLHSVPEAARFYLRVQVELLRAAGQPEYARVPISSVLGSGAALTAATSSQVAAALAAPARDLGITLYGRPRGWVPRDEDAWSRRWHINLHPIGGQARASQRTAPGGSPRGSTR